MNIDTLDLNQYPGSAGQHAPKAQQNEFRAVIRRERKTEQLQLILLHSADGGVTVRAFQDDTDVAWLAEMVGEEGAGKLTAALEGKGYVPIYSRRLVAEIAAIYEDDVLAASPLTDGSGKGFFVDKRITALQATGLSEVQAKAAIAALQPRRRA